MTIKLKIRYFLRNRHLFVDEKLVYASKMTFYERNRHPNVTDMAAELQKGLLFRKDFKHSFAFIMRSRLSTVDFHSFYRVSTPSGSLGIGSFFREQNFEN